MSRGMGQPQVCLILMGTKYGDDQLLSNQIPEVKPKVQNKMW